MNDVIELDEGCVIGNYRVIRALGQGGMGAVYEVEHTKLGVHYAMKTFTLQEGHYECRQSLQKQLS